MRAKNAFLGAASKTNIFGNAYSICPVPVILTAVPQMNNPPALVTEPQTSFDLLLLLVRHGTAPVATADRTTALGSRGDSFREEHKILFRRWLTEDLECRLADLRSYLGRLSAVSPPSISELIHGVVPDSASSHELVLFIADTQILSVLLRAEFHSASATLAERRASCALRGRGVLGWIREQPVPRRSIISDLASLTGHSHRHTQRLFREQVGVSFARYLRAVRLFNAARCLRTSVTIKEVAANVGYSRANNFVRDFTAQTGLSPSYYRESYRVLVAS